MAFLRAYLLSAVTRKSLKSLQGSNKASDDVLVSLLKDAWSFPEFMYTVNKEVPVQSVRTGDSCVDMPDVFDMHTDLHLITGKHQSEAGGRYVYMVTPSVVYVVLVPNMHTDDNDGRRDPLVSVTEADTLIVEEERTSAELNIGHVYDGNTGTLRVYRNTGRTISVKATWTTERGMEITVARAKESSPHTRDLVHDSLFLPTSTGAKEDKYGFLLHKSFHYCRAVGKESGTRSLLTKDSVINKLLRETIPPPSDQMHFLCPTAITYDKERECDHPSCSQRKVIAFDYCDMSLDPVELHVQTKYVAENCFTPAFYHEGEEEHRVLLSGDDLDRFPAKDDRLSTRHAVPSPSGMYLEESDNMAHHLPHSVFPGQTDLFSTTRKEEDIVRDEGGTVTTTILSTTQEQLGVLVTGVERKHGMCEVFLGRILRSSSANNLLEWSRVTVLGVDDSFRNNVDVEEGEYEEKTHTVWRIIPQTTMLLGFDRSPQEDSYRLVRLVELSDAVFRGNL